MCSLEHDTCANMFSSGLHKRQQKPPQLKLNLQSRESRGNLLCIISCNFPSCSAYHQVSASLSLKGIGDAKEQYRFLLLQSRSGRPCCRLWKSYLLIPKVLLTKYMLIYNPVQHKHSAAASLVITGPIHAQQAAAQAAPG